MSRAIIFDLDDTLMDTDDLKVLRDARNWHAVRTKMASSAAFAEIPRAVDFLREGARL